MRQMHSTKVVDSCADIPSERSPDLDDAETSDSKLIGVTIPEDCLGYLMKYLDLKSLV